MEEVVRPVHSKKQIRISARPSDSPELMGILSGKVGLSILGPFGGPKGFIMMTPEDTEKLVLVLQEAAIVARRRIIEQEQVEELLRIGGPSNA